MVLFVAIIKTVPRAFVLVLERLKVGYYMTGETSLVTIPVTALMGWQSWINGAGQVCEKHFLDTAGSEEEPGTIDDPGGSFLQSACRGIRRHWKGGGRA
ncbi:hypothetical protein HGM15179_011364 [Zosterops borbonicus]|uniref:Uncharacterized protein n=1 Tax=Zosterops borbonicus TaxID=364589 RepID=A0A8K1GDF2_9PASS|nr:hypothetical protein HGM15179_011364 [Zosterops borbonicus]